MITFRNEFQDSAGKIGTKQGPVAITCPWPELRLRRIQAVDLESERAPPRLILQFFVTRFCRCGPVAPPTVWLRAARRARPLALFLVLLRSRAREPFSRRALFNIPLIYIYNALHSGFNLGVRGLCAPGHIGR